MERLRILLQDCAIKLLHFNQHSFVQIEQELRWITCGWCEALQLEVNEWGDDMSILIAGVITELMLMTPEEILSYCFVHHKVEGGAVR